MNPLGMPLVILLKPGLMSYFVWILQTPFQISVGKSCCFLWCCTSIFMYRHVFSKQTWFSLGYLIQNTVSCIMSTGTHFSHITRRVRYFYRYELKMFCVPCNSVHLHRNLSIPALHVSKSIFILHT